MSQTYFHFTRKSIHHIAFKENQTSFSVLKNVIKAKRKCNFAEICFFFHLFPPCATLSGRTKISFLLFLSLLSLVSGCVNIVNTDVAD